MGEADTPEQRALLARCQDPGYTPGADDVPDLLNLWAHLRGGADGRARAKPVLKALARGEGKVARRLVRNFGEADPAERAARLRVLDRISRRIPIPELPDLLSTALSDPEPRVVREAARAIGKIEGEGGPRYESALLACLASAEPPEQRALVDALGRVGGEAARAALDALHPDDADVARRVRDGIDLLDRRRDRPGRGKERPAPNADRDLPGSVTVRLRCRHGAAEVVAEQAATALRVGARIVDPQTVHFEWDGDLRSLNRIRSALDVALLWSLPDAEDLASAVIEGLCRPDLVAALGAWLPPPFRFRLAFSGGGHRRALIREIVTGLGDRNAPLRNDSRGADWSIEVDEVRRELACTPRGLDDRFAYRVADVPAASHPTLAALLAWVARPTARDVVWDPFCGSALELIECARLRDVLQMYGTDLDAGALDAARANLQRAGLHSGVDLRHMDARRFEVPAGAPPVSLVITNPPLGHRVGAAKDLPGLLVELIRHVGDQLTAGGRMVWLTPDAVLTARAARRVGLRVLDRGPIDVGGLRAQLQILRQPGALTQASLARGTT